MYTAAEELEREGQVVAALRKDLATASVAEKAAVAEAKQVRV